MATSSSPTTTSPGHLRINVRDSDSNSDGTRGQNVIPIHLCHDVMKFMIPSVLVFVTLKYQGKIESVFMENPAAVWCFLIGSLIYWLIVGWMKRMEIRNGEWFNVLNRAALAAVVLSAASLASIFLSQRITFVPLMVLTPMPVLLLVQPSLYCAYTWVRFGIASFIERIGSRIASFIQKIRAKFATAQAALPE